MSIAQLVLKFNSQYNLEKFDYTSIFEKIFQLILCYLQNKIILSSMNTIKQQGFAMVTILITVLVIGVIGGSAYVIGKNSSQKSINTFSNQETGNDIINQSKEKDTSSAATVSNQIQVQDSNNSLEKKSYTACLKGSTPSITVLSPRGGETYTVGQQVLVKWTSCNVEKIWLGLGSGGKDFGEITYPDPISATSGSYEWTATNPKKSFTNSDINNYFIGFESQSPDILVKSLDFNVKEK